MLPEDQSSTITSLPFEAIANTSPAPIVLWDDEARCVFVNKVWCDLSGSAPQNNFGLGWLNYIDTRDRDRLTNAIKHIRQESISFRTVKSRTFTLRLSLYAAANSNTVIGWMSESSQPQADNESVNRMNVMETIIDSTISMISVVDKHFKVIYFNHQAEEYTGVGKDLVLGQNVFEVFPYLEKSDYRSYVQRALSGETVKTDITESLLQKGKYFETFYIPLKNISGDIEGVIVKVRDRTMDAKLQQELLEKNKLLAAQNKELVRQSQFSQSLFDSTIDVIAVVDTDFRYISINKKAMERYGLTKEQIEGKRIDELYPSVKSSGMYRDIGRALQGEFVRDMAYTSEVLNRSQFENYYVPLRDDQDNVYAVMIIAHEITEIVRTNEMLRSSNTELAEKNRELERSNNDLEQFAYVASHDLQEPIRKIATYTNKLLTRSKDELSDETAVYLQRINNSTRRMYELINGLLTYSRLVRQQDLFAKTSLDQIVRQVITDFDLKVRSKKAILKSQNTLPELEAIPIQMNQLFSNLISNSLKFAKEDVTPVIQIASIDLTPDQIKFYSLDLSVKYVSIFYLDNGIGFDQQFADKIFELFQRLHPRNKYEGSGIGLAICKKIVSNHHGLISVFSEEGKGVTFHIILPYTQRFR